MKIIIIDDNQQALEFLLELLKIYCPDLTLAGKASNIQEGKALIESVQPELVFLDVEMPTGSGFDLLEQLQSINFKVIFTTAHEKYALKAIRFSALDYLLKPINSEELIAAVNKARLDKQKEVNQLQINTLLQNLQNPPPQDQKILIKDKYGMQITLIKDIIRLEADGNYTKFFIQNQKTLMVSKPLKEYEAMLPFEQFFRCHKSHLINLAYILRYDKREEEVIILSDGSKVPVSRRKLEALMQKMTSL